MSVQLAPPATPTPTKNPSRCGVVTPEIGSHPGWPLVLYFHHVRVDIEHYTVLRPDDFSFALDLLCRWFRPMDPRCLESSPDTWPNEPTCLLTFDDGYRDVWEHAVPAMEERGWRAVMFVSTGQVGTVEEHPDRGALEHMTWSQLRKLRARGHVVASHGHTHRDMSLLSPEGVCAEIATARTSLARELGPGPVLVAYPYGNQPDAFEALTDTLPPLCFGSVKAPPAPWTECPWLIRRTFLPTGAMDRWPAIVKRWRRQWENTASL
jgi:peptidoglycan/xylan/chitin deacetylase (PgdA/CDA1 family)